MSDIDVENLKKEKKQEKAPLIVNSSNDQTNSNSNIDTSTQKKKSTLKFVIIGGGVLVALILVIVLSVTLTKSGVEQKNYPTPITPPPIPSVVVSPFQFQETNNFVMDSQPTTNDWVQSTIIKFNPPKSLSTQKHVGDSMNGNTYKPVDPKSVPIGANNMQPARAQLDFSLIDNYQAQIIIMNPDDDKQYKVSDVAFERPVMSFEARFTQVGFAQSGSDQPYSFNFSDIYTGETLISTYKRKLVIEEKFSEIGFVLPTKRIFGLGQRNSQFQLKNGTYSLWSRDRQNGLPSDNQEGGLNGPHIHPFILAQTKSKDFFGMFFLGSSAQSFEVVYYPGNEEIVLNYISLGGQLEMYFIMRGTASEIISKYHALIGYSMMPPYYALGLFQGSNSYNTQEQIESVISGYSNMMLEGVIIDNYNDGSNHPYTVNTATFQDMPSLVASIAQNKQHLIVGVKSGVANDGNDVYNSLLASKCYVSSGITQKELVGMQETTVIYPDFQCDDIQGFLEDQLGSLRTQVKFEGLVLQDNTPLTWVNGEVLPSNGEQSERLLQNEQYSEEKSGNWTQSYLINQNQDQISTYNLPFIPGYYWAGNLDNMSISLNATHSGGAKEIDVHNLYGHMNAKKVAFVIKEGTDMSLTGKRFIVFSDSTFAGSGKHSAVAINNLWRSWSSLKTLISQTMSFSMYGVSNVASDVCGSYGVIDYELCGRWAQLSAFLPMMRNYYNATYRQWIDGTNKEFVNTGSEFYNFPQDKYEYEFMATSAVSQRLQFSRYIYSQMYKVYRYGGSLVYPLFFDFPNDDASFDNADSTFMIGDSIKVSPVLESGVTDEYEAYFPQGVWADLNRMNTTVSSNGEMLKLKQNAAFTNIHLKAGRIIPFQLNTDPQTNKRTIDFESNLKVSFVIHRDDSQYAEGYTLVDDGISANTWGAIDYSFWKLRYASKSINFWIDQGNATYTPPETSSIDLLESIQILKAFDIANTDFACYLGKSLNPTPLAFEYNPFNDILTIRPIDGARVSFKDIGFIKFGSSHQEPNFCNPDTAFSYKVTYIDPALWTDTSISMHLQSKQGTKFLKELFFTATLMDDIGTINVNITTLEDVNNGGTKKFKVPFVTDFTGFNAPTKQITQFFDFKSDPFSYKIFQEGDSSSVYYESDPKKFYFDDYMVFDSGIFSLNEDTGFPLMGMGERAGSLFYKNEQGGIHSRYTFDQANPLDDGLPPGRNMYGYQPFYVYQSNLKNWVGVFDLSTYATDYVLDFNNGVNTQITKIVIGGSIQKYFFVGAKPDDVIRTYSKLVGMQTMPPLWSFGWQQCRFGWKTDTDWQTVVDSYDTYDLPLDTMWADIDYMDDYKIFTISQSRYSKLPQQVEAIRAKNMTFVPIMDVGVAVRPNNDYYAYDQGMEQDIFIKVSDGSHPLTAGVWPGHAYFPDFWHENINNYWHAAFENLTTNYGLEFDGIWIDMNEATNFCNGYCIPSERPVDSLRNKPYYVPGWRDLEDKALGVDGLHSNGWHEYDLHSTYSLLQVKSTSEYLIQKKGVRPYVLSRSNFPGLSEYGYHWMGDNWSTQEYMALSVDGMYHYQLFALPFSGSDICGFDGDAMPTLCTRWHQLGSLYPFARNHNQNASIDQEPYVFLQNYAAGVTYTDIIRTALRNRYSLIKYYYSHFYDLSEFGGSFFKPLFFEFTADPNAYLQIQKNIMLGEGLKASIEVTTLTEGDVDFYFPAATWCQLLPTLGSCFVSTGMNQTLPSKLTDYYVHIREGNIIPFQDATKYNVRTTKDLLSLNTDLLVLPLSADTDLSTQTSPSVQASAIGYLYIDNGVGFADKSTRFDFYFSMGLQNAVLTVAEVRNGYDRTDNREEYLGILRILFAKGRDLDKVTKASVIQDDSGNQEDLQTPVYDSVADILSIEVTLKADGSRVSLYDIDQIILGA